jgi:hypothetical protein
MFPFPRHEGVWVRTFMAPFILNLGIRSRRVVKITPPPLRRFSLGIQLGCPLNRRLFGPRIILNDLEKGIFSIPYRDSKPVLFHRISYPGLPTTHVLRDFALIARSIRNIYLQPLCVTTCAVLRRGVGFMLQPLYSRGNILIPTGQKPGRNF